MFQNAVIDIAIGLILMYLVLSLVCTVVNEFIATKLRLRATSLESGLKQLLDDPTLREKFYGHGLIEGISKSVARGGEALDFSLRSFAAKVVRPVDERLKVLRGAAPATPATPAAPTPTADPTTREVAPPNPMVAEHPSYVSADTFTKALLGSLLGSLDPAKPVPGIAEVSDAIKKLPDSSMRDALQSCLTTAGPDLDKLRTEVAKWFDDSMERLGGAYKRQLKWISLIIGLFVAVVVNADSFDVGYALWSDNALRAQMVQAASVTVQNGLPDVQNPTPTDVAVAFENANKTLRPLPIGWPLRTAPGKPSVLSPASIWDWDVALWLTFIGLWAWFLFAKLIGWGVTAFALSLGAPFWFDLLSKFVNLRGSGTKPQRASG